MNTQAIEQLREALEMAKRELILWIDNYYDTESSVKRAVATSPAIKTIDAAIASLPTAQPTEVYVAVSKQEWFETEDKSQFIGGRKISDGEVTWLKPTKAILIPE